MPASRPRSKALHRQESPLDGRQEARVGIPAALPLVKLPAIPAKRYFTIGEVSELCGVKPYVLRYWEQEFSQLRPMKRRGNRRYYQHHEVLLVRRIRELLYEQGFTISGARNQLVDGASAGAGHGSPTSGDGALARAFPSGAAVPVVASEPHDGAGQGVWHGVDLLALTQQPDAVQALRAELLSIRDMLL